MLAYNHTFAHVYNQKWSFFAKNVAPFLEAFYASTPIGQENKSVLDLCCGAGHLAMYFLDKGYRLVGLDLSEHMLDHARENACSYVESSQARFIQADASDFKLEQRFGLVVSTFDALNHLENEQALRKCFECVHAVCDGYFIFDLNTRLGLRRWNNMTVDENSDDAVIITRGIYDGLGDKAWTRITGFIQVPGGLWERFEQTAFNTVFDMEKVREALLEVGWKDVRFALIQDLETPLLEPEKEMRVFIVAGRL